MPVDTLSTNGFIFIWVINAKYSKAFELMKKWGYTYVAPSLLYACVCQSRRGKKK